MASNESFFVEPSQSAAWQDLYDAVLLEYDTRTLFKRVEAAEAAILTRRETLEQHPDGHSERQAIVEALAYLAEVKKERLRF